MPGIPPPMGIPAAGAASLDGLSATMDSVVSTIAAMLAAFCSALLVTLVGSTMPSAIMSTYFSVRALKPTPLRLRLMVSTITAPSRPAL